MSEPKDPEQLLAQALRAQAVRAPHTPAPEATGAAGSGRRPAARPSSQDPQQPAPSTVQSPVPQYGLLSGIGAASLEAENAALGPAAPAAEPATTTTTTGRTEQAGQPTTHRAAASNRLPAHWILLLAVLLGLATGAVIGLITLL